MVVCEIPLSRGRFALVDMADYDRVAAHRWYAFRVNRVWYAASAAYAGVGRPRTYLHRFIMGEPPGLEVDHRNGDGLDCRRDNLRTATHQQNLANQRLSRANTSGYKGVSFFKRDGTWAAQTKYHGRFVWLGRYRTPEEAARVYDAKMRELHGEFARCNFPAD